MKIIAWPAFKTKYKNPYNWLLYSHMLELGVTVEEFTFSKLLLQHYDIFHLHWPTETILRHPNLVVALLRVITMLLTIKWAKVRGTKIIWTIHDEYPHSLLHPQLANWFQSKFIKELDGCISHSQVGKELTLKNFPSLQHLPHLVIFHGHYRQVYPNNITRETARTNLDIPPDCHLLLFLGYIDYYKNVPHLVQVFRELNPTDWLLLIAGKIEVPELGTEILNLAVNDFKVKLRFGFVPDEQLQLYFKAADLVVLPFQEILNSGSAILSLSFDSPILVTDKGSMAELQEQVGDEWVKLYSGELTTEVLATGLDWAIEGKRSRQANLEKLGWSRLAEKTVQYFEHICNQNL
ncbi:glycosyltransferase family 4 protein [Chlorogloeopsis sp. ULAP01]|uniref:glycosyltransferase family 4 protein n=1 Tax=Chlorogloeopsis sp. ULAP01 TaxID=3056483 RepID=UPI0025AA78C3|nr:glycosyltransferase family 4 protein [Chlorogloeopsis sp. ULAP01]MDM9381072.1 glycosyltransferase family 4 protein [Chlorogloeopsis sp. ULAP01]